MLGNTFFVFAEEREECSIPGEEKSCHGITVLWFSPAVSWVSLTSVTYLEYLRTPQGIACAWILEPNERAGRDAQKRLDFPLCG
jgi:hypothetical protein